MDVIIKRGFTTTLDKLPNYSIALDGYCQGPNIDAENHRFSFDHHSHCFRYCTLASCMQAWTAIGLGLDPSLYTIYCNDVDTDVCAAVWCLQNPDKYLDPLVVKLINAIGISDAHAGAFKGLNGMTKTVGWISAPETDSKRNNDYYKLSETGLNSIMEAVLHRIDLYVSGEAQNEIIKQPKHGEYKILRNQNDWILIESQDPHVLSSVYNAGFDRVVVTRPQSDGSTAVTFAKRSDFITNFPLNKIYEEINKLEPGAGGSTSLGGVIRNSDGSRSRLPLSKITEIVDICINDDTNKNLF